MCGAGRRRREREVLDGVTPSRRENEIEGEGEVMRRRRKKTEEEEGLSDLFQGGAGIHDMPVRHLSER